MKFKKYSTATDTCTTLPATFQTSGADVENYQVYGDSDGSGVNVSIQLDEPLCGLDNSIDSLDLLSGLLTRQIKKVILDGTEDWSIINPGQNSNYFRLSYADYDYGYDNKVVCSHYTYAPITTSTTNVGINVLSSSSANAFVISIRPTNAASMTRTDFKTWLADQYTNGTPVTVWFILKSAETETIIVPSGLSGTLEGYLTQSTAPTENNPIYPVANGTKLPNNKYEVFQSYKIPILNTSGVTENFYDDETSSDKKLLDGLGDLSNNSYYKTSDYIDCTGGSKINCYGVSVFDSNRLVRIAFYDNNRAFLSEMDSEIFISGNYSFTFTAPQNACYFRFSFIRTDTDVSATLRYESNYDLFLGDTKLYEDEYLDYQEQKVYKRTANIWDKDNIESFINPSTGTSIDRVVCHLTAGTYSILNGTSRNIYYVKASNDTQLACAPNSSATLIAEEVETGYPFLYLQGADTQTGDITVVTGSTIPAQHIPYIQPTDPPLPFPTISTYIGENSIDVDTTVQPDKVVLTVAAWREIEAKKYVNGSWTDIVVRRYENGAWVPSPIPENNIANLQGLLTLLEDHWLPGVNDYRSMILVRTNRNDDTANQLCYMLTCYSTNPSPHFESEFLNNRYWLNDYAVPYSGTDFYLRKFSWSQGGGWVYDGDESNKRDDYFVPIDSNTYNVYLLRLGSSTQYDNNAGYQYFYDLSAYF